MPVIYQAECSECGADIKLSNFRIDRDGDVTVDIHPCEKCIETAGNDGYEKGAKDASQKQS